MNFKKNKRIKITLKRKKLLSLNTRSGKDKPWRNLKKKKKKLKQNTKIISMRLKIK